jgi:hypothetical protein
MWLSPVVNHTAASYFNITDWARINDNTAEVAAQFDLLSITYDALTVLTPPTITDIPTAAGINFLFENVDKLRDASGLTIPAIKFDYVAGMDEVSPDFDAFNQVEAVLLTLYDWSVLELAP